jgi:SAM-dependent methyltransferase
MLARIYDQARPPVPDEAVDWLADPIERPYREVLELGAGTGQFTAQLIRWIPTVHAIEPDRRLLTTLRHNCPAVVATLGRGEALPLVEASVDAVFAVGSWDWFEQYAATAEVARVLRPSGRLAVAWNNLDHSAPWVAELDERVARHHVPCHEPGMFALPDGASFSLPEQKVISWHWNVSPVDLGLLFGSYRQALDLPAEKRAAVSTEVKQYIAEHPELVEGDVVRVPIRTTCYRTQLKA